MNKIKEHSKDTFDRQALTYDTDIKGQHARSIYPILLSKLSENSYHTALDLGCGTGEMMKRILQQDRTKDLYGIDLSENMLAQAKSKLGSQVHLCLGDSEHLPFSDNFFDAVYCNDSFHHYPAPQKVLQEVYRVLKPGGIFLMGDCWQPAVGRAIMNLYMRFSKDGDVKIYSEAEIRKLFSEWFSFVSWERVGNTACVAMGKK